MWKPSIFCTDDELCKKAIDRAKKNDYKVKYRKALMNSLSKDAKKHGIDEWEAHKTFMHIELDRMLTRIVIFIMIVVAIVVTIIRSL